MESVTDSITDLEFVSTITGPTGIVYRKLVGYLPNTAEGQQSHGNWVEFRGDNGDSQRIARLKCSMLSTDKKESDTYYVPQDHARFYVENPLHSCEDGVGCVCGAVNQPEICVCPEDTIPEADRRLRARYLAARLDD